MSVVVKKTPAAGARGTEVARAEGMEVVLETGNWSAEWILKKELAAKPNGKKGFAGPSELMMEVPSEECDAVTTRGGGSRVDDMVYYSFLVRDVS